MRARAPGERFSEVESVAAYREQIGGGGRLLVDLLIDREYASRAHGVGGVAEVLFGQNGVEFIGRGCRQAGIDENHLLALLQIGRVLDLQLEIGE